MLPIKKKNKKITKMKRFPLFNIGTLMFGIVFVYMIICIVIYLTSTHVTAYEVTAGPLSGNYRFSALALKSEKIVTAEQSGNINYYAREGSKITFILLAERFRQRHLPRHLPRRRLQQLIPQKKNQKPMLKDSQSPHPVPSQKLPRYQPKLKLQLIIWTVKAYPR